MNVPGRSKSESKRVPGPAILGSDLVYLIMAPVPFKAASRQTLQAFARCIATKFRAVLGVRIFAGA
jgi:hypothetical protein